LTISYLAKDKNNLHAPYGALHKIDKKLKTEDIWTEKEVFELEIFRKKYFLDIRESQKENKIGYSRNIQLQCNIG